MSRVVHLFPQVRFHFWCLLMAQHYGEVDLKLCNSDFTSCDRMHAQQP